MEENKIGRDWNPQNCKNWGPKLLDPPTPPHKALWTPPIEWLGEAIDDFFFEKVTLTAPPIFSTTLFQTTILCNDWKRRWLAFSLRVDFFVQWPW